MARVVELRSYHGATEDAGFDILDTEIAFKLSDLDLPEPNVSGGIQIPSDGHSNVYSYIKNIRAYANTAAPYWLGNLTVAFTQRPRIWTGTRVYITTSDAYIDPLAQGTAPLDGFENNIGEYGANSPLRLNGYLYNPDTGPLGDWIHMQISVTPSSIGGVLDPIRLIINWQEWTQT